ncbi:MAG: gliding motility-associated C-terminal domain-containing protein [Bacteroidota bacterium]
MSYFYPPKLIRKIALYLLPLFLGLLVSFEAAACDGSGFTVDAIVDNGDGTYTLTVTVTLAGVDWVGGTFGGSRGFYFNTDRPVVSVTPPSFTSANGTTLPAVVGGNNINWGNPGGGPFFVGPMDNTQSFTFNVVVSGRPTTWTGGGQEENNCVYTGNFPCPLPTLTLLQGDQFICEGEIVVLSVDAQGAQNVIWSTGETGTSIAVSPTMTTTYTVTATNECGSVDESVTININPRPSLFPTFDMLDICPGDTVVLEVITDFVDNINWSPPIGNSPIVQVSPTTSTLYTMIGSNDCGQESVDIMVNVLPDPTVIPINPLTQLCIGESVSLDALVDFGDIIFWSNGGSNTENNVVTPTSSTTYTIFVGNSCGVDSADFEVLVDSLPEITSINPDIDICPGQTVDLAATATNANTYIWTPGGSTDSTTTVTPTDTTTYSLIATNDCGQDTADVTVNILPDILETINLEACPGATASFNGQDLNPNTSTDFSFTSRAGCDSIITVVVDELPDFSESITLQACRGSSVTYDGRPLQPNTVTTFTFQAFNGCDSVITVTVDEVATFTSTLDLAACPGETVPYNNQDLSVNTSQDFQFLASNGCDSIVTVNVDELPTFAVDLQLNACEGGTVAYNGQDLNPNTSTDFTFQARNGCDSVVTVMVTEIPTLTSSLSLATCPGTTVSYNGQDLNPNTSTDFTLQARTGCDSIVTVVVDELPTFASDLNLVACSNETVDYNGQSLSPNTSTPFTLRAANGCDSVVTVIVNEALTFTSDLTLQACENGTVAYNGQDLNPNTTTPFLLTAANGCDSTVTVRVDEVGTINTSLTLETCPGGTASYNGQDLNVNTVTPFTFTARSGCDSIVTVTVDEIQNFTSSLTLEACAGESATYNGQDLNPNTTTPFTFTATNGCDSIVSVTVDELPTFTSDLMLEACEGTTIDYNGQTLLPNSTTPFTFAARNGCDSVVTVIVDELLDVTASLTLETCTGTTIAFNGQDLNPGSSTDFAFVAANGCDSTLTVIVDELMIFASDLQLQTCPNTPVSYNGQSLDPNTTTPFTFRAVNGCDSIVTVFVEEISTFSSTLDLETCAGTTIDYNGQSLQPNSSTDFNLSAINGCDSVVTVNVAELPVFSSDVVLEACEGTTVDYDGQPLQPGSSTNFTLRAINGCDSVVTVQVDELFDQTASLTLEACTGTTVDFNGQTLAPASSTDFNFTAANGCDSTLTVIVDELDVFASTLTLRTCPNTPIDYDGQSLQPNSVTDVTFVARNGCDSTVTVTVNEVAEISETLEFEACSGTTIDYNGQTLLPGETARFTFSATNGCDSNVTVNVTELFPSQFGVDFEICSGTTADYNGQTLQPNTTTDFTFVASNGCDSVVTVTVDELPVFDEQVDLQTCRGSTVTFNGQTLQPGSSTVFSFTTINGCDSTILVEVEEVATFTSILDLQACTGNSVTYRGQNLNAGSSTPFTLVASNGCDSIVTVVVEELTNFTSDLALEVCQGSTITYDGMVLQAGAMMPFSFVAQNGCDSTVNVSVDELPTFDEEVMLSTCTGTTIEFDGQTLQPNSRTPFNYTAINGCDSVVTVIVDELSIFSSNLQLQACASSTAVYNGSVLQPGSTTSFNLTARNGCDSVVTVFVESLPEFATDELLQTCDGTTATYNGSVLQPGSVTPFTLTSIGGCDSVVTVTVEELPTFSSTLQLQTCADEPAFYNNTSLEPFSITDFTLTARNGCDSVVTVFVTDVIPLSTSEESVTICFGDSLLAFGSYVRQPGTYSGTFLNAAGCDSTHTILLEVLPELVLSLDGENSCANEASGSVIASVRGGEMPYRYLWDNGQTEASLSNIPSGSYRLTVTDNLGCENIQDITIDDYSIDLETLPQDVSCFGFSDGLVDFPNADPNWLFSLDGTNFGPPGSLGGLSAGTYQVFIQDENNCLYQERFVIDQPALLIVSLPKDTLITLGNDLILYTNTNGQGNLTYEWTPETDLDCSDCPDPLAAPLQTTLYKLTIIDENDCIAEDEINVVVRNDFKVYIPNAFSPDGNNVNDVFMIFSDESVAKVHELRIYSRWGSQLFEVQDFLPNDPQYGWDGSYKGQTMNPGVYVYYALIEFKDGNTKQFKGSVTLVK